MAEGVPVELVEHFKRYVARRALKEVDLMQVRVYWTLRWRCLQPCRGAFGSLASFLEVWKTSWKILVRVDLQLIVCGSSPRHYAFTKVCQRLRDGDVFLSCCKEVVLLWLVRRERTGLPTFVTPIEPRRIPSRRYSR